MHGRPATVSPFPPRRMNLRKRVDLNVRRIDSAKLLPEVREAWDQLAGDPPFRQYSWLTKWWNDYGCNDSLYVLVVTDGAARVTGIAPWYLHRGGAPAERSVSWETVTVQRPFDRALRTRLGTCGCAGTGPMATAANHGQHREHRWDQLCLAEVKPDDATIGQLVARLGSRVAPYPTGRVRNFGNSSCLRAGKTVSRAALQSHRKQLRRLARELDSGLYRVREARLRVQTLR